MPLLATTVAVEPTAGTVADIFGQVLGLFGRINWASPSWDLFIVIFFVVTVFLYGMSLGRDRIIIILVSIYMALAVVSNAPFIDSLGNGVQIGGGYVLQVTTFLGLFVLLFFMLSRSALMKTFGNMAAGSWWQVLIFSVFHVGLLVSITLSFLPGDAINNLAPMTRLVFASEMSRFVWVVAPIGGMVVLKS
ncbi:hypothetical protein ACFL26_02450 [Patescibacteria group bacterium]